VGTNLPAALRALADCGLADQLEQIKITPEYLSTEEMSKLWTAVQSHYRPTAAYMATVVLIESSQARAPLPVLTAHRRQAEPVPPFPTIESALPTKQPAAPWATVDITGHHLDGTNRLLSNSAFKSNGVTAAGGSAPDAAHRSRSPVGVYQLAVRVRRESSRARATVGSAHRAVTTPCRPASRGTGGTTIT
jgi:hypothetical protein